MSEFGKYDVYAVSGSIYCYKDTNVLKNRFDIRDGDVMADLQPIISARFISICLRIFIPSLATSVEKIL